ncbi:phage antirepressor [Desulfosporosinus sp. OT]|uniref:phage antirepressor n=1 Tax=Desulfosporosinus sp. OT TaxID=913865 RepID=UPI000223ADB5|nr:phage antirepressor [Desulfosporosinus sp. OT]EGW38986.1 BRO family, N-terminal domain protein [Desulfosporosinus sp. OT]
MQTLNNQLNSSLQEFAFQNHNVRIIIKDGEPWFVAKDVCDVLELSDTRRAVERLDEDERSLTPLIDSIGRSQQLYIVNEPGLYSLILRSRKQVANQFKRWVTHDVLPSIRKTGLYSIQQHAQQQLPAPKNYREAMQVIADLFPKAQAFEEFLSVENACTIRNAAKYFGIGEKHFKDLLKEQKLFVKDGTAPLQKYIDRGYFNITFAPRTFGGKKYIFPVILITPKGLMYLSKKFNLKPACTPVLPYSPDLIA